MTSLEPTIASKRIYNGKVVGLRVDTIRLPDGQETIREVVEHGESVAIVPVDTEGNVILVRQYRKPVERTLLEVPAGSVEEGEDPVACAQRELLEETGYSASHIEPIASFYTTPGFCTELMHAYLATGLTAGEAQPEFDEQITVLPVPLQEIADLIHRREIQDAKSIASLLLVLDRLSSSTI